MEKLDTSDILSEIELDKIVKFNEDRIMFQAVKKYLLAHLYQHGVLRPGEPHNPFINWALNTTFSAIAPPGDARGINTRHAPKTDAELGSDLRATAKGIQIIESCFQELEQVKKPEKLPEEGVSAE